MKSKNKIKYIFVNFCIIFSVLSLISTFVLCINVVENKGILPIVFFLLLCFYITYYLSYLPFDYFGRNIKYKFKLEAKHIIECVKVILILIMIYFSIKIFWI